MCNSEITRAHWKNAECAKIKIFAPRAEPRPINGLAGAKIRCKSPPMSAIRSHAALAGGARGRQLPADWSR